MVTRNTISNRCTRSFKQFTVNYEERPSVTGMFQVGGPLGASIGQYGTHIKGCNCPPCSSDVDPTKKNIFSRIVYNAKN